MLNDRKFNCNNLNICYYALKTVSDANLAIEKANYKFVLGSIINLEIFSEWFETIFGTVNPVLYFNFRGIQKLDLN